MVWEENEHAPARGTTVAVAHVPAPPSLHPAPKLCLKGAHKRQGQGLLLTEVGPGDPDAGQKAAGPSFLPSANAPPGHSWACTLSAAVPVLTARLGQPAAPKPFVSSL